MTELRPGWLRRQAEKAEKDMRSWPDWMIQNMAFDDCKTRKESSEE